MVSWPSSHSLFSLLFHATATHDFSSAHIWSCHCLAQVPQCFRLASRVKRGRARTQQASSHAGPTPGTAFYPVPAALLTAPSVPPPGGPLNQCDLWPRLCGQCCGKSVLGRDQSRCLHPDFDSGGFLCPCPQPPINHGWCHPQRPLGGFRWHLQLVSTLCHCEINIPLPKAQFSFWVC